jgi:hypothetical protein
LVAVVDAEGGVGVFDVEGSAGVADADVDNPSRRPAKW